MLHTVNVVVDTELQEAAAICSAVYYTVYVGARLLCPIGLGIECLPLLTPNFDTDPFVCIYAEENTSETCK